MGKRGPSPKPTHLRLLEGNAGKRPINENEPQPTGAIGEPPDHLSDEARSLWREIAAHAPPGMLTRVDRSALAAFCVAWHLHKKGLEQLEEEGEVVKSALGSPMRNPWVIIVNQQAQILAQFSSKFGLTPGDRAGLKGGNGGAPLSERQRRGLMFQGKIAPKE